MRERLKRFAKKVANVQAWLLLTAFYLVILAPFAMLVQWTNNPFSRKSAPAWRDRETEPADRMDQATRQF